MFGKIHEIKSTFQFTRLMSDGTRWFIHPNKQTESEKGRHITRNTVYQRKKKKKKKHTEPRKKEKLPIERFRGR